MAGAKEGELLFVYGTLRRGGGREDLLCGCQCLGDARTPGYLYDLRAYPAFVPAEQGVVHGEVWRCPRETLIELDSYEGVDEGLFERIEVETNRGRCWAYAAGSRLRRQLTGRQAISTGRWPTRPLEESP